MRAKSAANFTGLRTPDLITTSIDLEMARNLTSGKIYINEYLPKDLYRQYLDLKETAKMMGFKYIWHRGGRFLVKWHNGCLSHALSSRDELRAVYANFGPTPPAKDIALWSGVNSTFDVARGSKPAAA